MTGSIRSGGAAIALAVAAVLAAAPSQAAAVAPCTARTTGGEWPVYGHDVANTRTQPAAPAIGPTDVAGMKAAWVFSTDSTGDGTGFDTTPIVDGGCVFLGSYGGTAYALDAGTGKVVWQHKLDVPNPGYGGDVVGAAVVHGHSVIFLVNNDGGPYAIALDRSTGAEVWRSAPFITGSGSAIQSYYTNASPIIANGLVVAGYSGAEGDPKSSGGFALIDADTGKLVKVTPTIPPADQAKGYGGGGLWSTPAYDPATKYVYWGAGNPSSKQIEHQNTNAILKIDLDRSRPTFGQIVASYKGNVDQYEKELQELSHSPVCAASDNPSVPYPLDDPACGQLDLDFGAAANLFTLPDGTRVVGELQKSGIYHVVNADSMAPAWTKLVGLSCFACNAASTAFDGSSVDVVGTPGGNLFSLARGDGTANWTTPTGDATHYHPISAGDGVVWTLDNNGTLDAFDAKSGQTLAHRPLGPDAGSPVMTGGSGGIALAEGKLFAATGSTGLGDPAVTGYVIAYQPGG